VGNTYTNYNVTTFNDIDLELFLLTEILKLKSLHYGYFKKGEKANPQTFPLAQRKYTKTLLRWIPKGVKTILDVGAGIGDNAQALADKGYHVTAVTPDKNHKKFYDAIKNKKITFVNSTFESFWADKKFDLILMSESQNYFDTDIGFQQCVKNLHDKGYLFVSGKFRKKKNGAFNNVTNLEKEYKQKAKDYGFSLLKEKDITQNVLPTLEFIDTIHREYALPGMQMIDTYIKKHSPLKVKIMKFIFRKQIKEFDFLYNYFKEHFDPDHFKDNLRYLRLLFQYRK